MLQRGRGVTVTVTLQVPEPPGPVAVPLYVVVVAGRSDREPLVPDQLLLLPVTVMEVASLEDQLIVVLLPSMMAVGDADKEQVAGVACGV